MTYEELYDLCVANGCEPRLADMLASRSFPGTKGTDRAFLQGRSLGIGQFADVPLIARHHERIAEAAGVSTVGQCYLSTLARYPGDPEAWVSDLHDVRSRCLERGWGCEGAISMPARSGDPDTGHYAVADDLVDRYVEDRLVEQPEMEPHRESLRAELADRLSGVHGHGGG